MIRAFALFLCLTTGQAAALSCVEPDIARSFKSYDENPNDFVIFKGKLSFDVYAFTWEQRQGQSGADGEDAPTASFDAALSGQLLTKDGFTASAPETIKMDIYCSIGWCGGAPRDEEVIAFAEVTDQGLTLSLGLCSDALFYRPDTRLERRLMRCVRGQNCNETTR